MQIRYILLNRALFKAKCSLDKLHVHVDESGRFYVAFVVRTDGKQRALVKSLAA